MITSVVCSLSALYYNIGGGGAAPGLQAIMNGYKAMESNDNKSLVTCLETITQSLHNMRSILKKMYEHAL